MKKSVALSLSFNFTLFAAITSAAPLTYNLFAEHSAFVDTNVAVDVVGSITTDGTLGTISASDIISWTFTVTIDGQPPYTAVSGQPTAAMTAEGLFATDRTLSLLFPPTSDGTFGALTLHEGTISNGYALSFANTWYPPASPNWQPVWQTGGFVEQSINTPATGFISYLAYLHSATYSPTPPDMITIATVPEPGSAVSAVMGAFLLATVGHRRARLCRSTQT